MIDLYQQKGSKDIFDNIDQFEPQVVRKYLIMDKCVGKDRNILFMKESALNSLCFIRYFFV